MTSISVKIGGHANHLCGRIENARVNFTNVPGSAAMSLGAVFDNALSAGSVSSNHGAMVTVLELGKIFLCVLMLYKEDI